MRDRKRRAAGSKGDSDEAAFGCDACPLRSNASFRPFTAREAGFIAQFKTGELVVQAGAPVLLDGHDSPHLFTVLEGWVLRYKNLENGERQVLNFGFPGDLIGLQSTLFDKMQHSVEALTDVRLCVFSRKRLWELYEKHPDLAFDVTWLAAREESILGDHLVNIGRRTAFERLAYMLLYIFERAQRSGLAKGDAVKTPVTQEHLADALGLSLVHTNKTLRRLTATGCVEWERGQLHVRDVERLGELASYPMSDRPSRPFL